MTLAELNPNKNRVKTELEPYDDCISRQVVLDMVYKSIYEFFDICGNNEEVSMSDKDKMLLEVNKAICNKLKQLPLVTPKGKTGHCKDCKWWKDNDGVYRRGVGAESRCPINRKEVYEGNGYCFLFEP